MATRLYFPTTDAAAVTPAFDSSWNYTTEALRRKLNNTKGTTAITAGTQIGPWTVGQKALDRQYISTRMAAGVAFTFAGALMSAQLMVREFATGDDVTRTWVVVKIISEDGNTVRRVWHSGIATTSAEFINNATHRNKILIAGSTTTDGADYTTVQGDRILVEIGYWDAATGASPEASAKWGENATDLPVNETQTTDGAGWIEFSNTITFIGEASNNNVLAGCGVLTAVGFAPAVIATNNQSVAPGVGAVTVTGFAPSVQIGVNILPSVGSAIITGFAPTVAVTDNKNVSTGVGDVVVNGFSPSVSITDHKNVLPGTGVVLATGFAPLVNATDHKNVLPGAGDIVVTGFSPTVTATDNKNILPSTGAVIVTGFAPFVNTGNSINVQPGLGEVVIDGFAPSVVATDHQMVVTGTGELVVTGFSPLIQSGGSIEVNPSTGEIIITGFAPTIANGQRRRPGKIKIFLYGRKYP